MERSLLIVLALMLLILAGCTQQITPTVTVTQTAVPISTSTETPAPVPTFASTTSPVSTSPPLTIPTTMLPTRPTPPPTSRPTTSSPPVPTTKDTKTPSITWREVDAPSNAIVDGARWIEVGTPESKTMLAAVFTPQGTGPFPVIVWLHGTNGFIASDVILAQDFSKAGFIGVAAGWFGGHYTGLGPNPSPLSSSPDQINWSNSPDIDTGSKNIMTIINAARTLPKASANRIGAIGWSRGSAVLITTVARGGNLQAIVAGAGYPSNVSLDGIKIPVLILQGTADTGVSAESARAFESALRAQGGTVESYYFEGAPHAIPQTSPWREEMLQLVYAFFTKYLMS